MKSHKLLKIPNKTKYNVDNFLRRFCKKMEKYYKGRGLNKYYSEVMAYKEYSIRNRTRNLIM